MGTRRERKARKKEEESWRVRKVESEKGWTERGRRVGRETKKDQEER